MPHIIPIRDLKEAAELAELCRSTNEPVFVTENGYGDMVVMSKETYEKTMLMNDVYRKLYDAEQSVKNGDVMDAFESLKELRENSGV